jgi:2-keto-4-pentenoate hydratase
MAPESSSQVSLDPRLAAALTVQLQARSSLLASGARRVGWKLGVGERERLGSGPVVGHLTTGTLLAPGATYRPATRCALYADVEIALVLGADVAPDADRDAAEAVIAGYGAALEFVDLDPALDTPDAIVARNVFHRAVAFAASHQPTLPTALEGRAMVNGNVRDAAPATRDYPRLVQHVAGMLGAMGLTLQHGDRLITGSIVQVPVEPGDRVTADLRPLGHVGLSIAA